MHEKYAIQQPISSAPVTHPVIFADNCDCTFNYEASGTGADWVTQYATPAAHSCLKGISLLTRPTAPAIGDLVTIWKYLPLPSTSLLTLQFLFMHRRDYSARFIVDLTVFLADRTEYSAALRFSRIGNLVEYRDPDYNWVVIPALSYCPSPLHWNHVLLAISWHPPLFNLITVNNSLYAPPALPLFRGAHVGCLRTRLLFTLETRTNNYAVVNIDHILLTPNNP